MNRRTAEHAATLQLGQNRSLRKSHRRSVVADTQAILQTLNCSIADVEGAVSQYDVPQYSRKVLDQSRTSYLHFVEHLCFKALNETGSSWPSQAHVDRSKPRIEEELKAGLHTSDVKSLVTYLHFFALSGRGRINEETVEHTNLRAFDRDDAEALLTDHDSAPRETGASQDIDASLLACDDFDDSNDEDRGQDADASTSNDYDDALPNRAQQVEPSFNLDDAEMAVVQSLTFEPPPGSRPLALSTIVSHFNNIARHLEVYALPINLHVKRSVLRILRHLSIKRGFYPSGELKKVWLTTATVKALRAGVWNIVGHSKKPAGRSVVSLLSLHTMTILLDQYGGRVSTWLDESDRKEGEIGRYLRWSMVSIKFCGYDQATGWRPSFVVNVTTNATKQAEGDRRFHKYSFVSKKNQHRSDDVAFAFAALAVLQGVAPGLQTIFEDRKHGQSLLSQSTDGFIQFHCSPAHDNAPVFIFGHVLHRDPRTECQPFAPVQLLHPADKPAFGKYHYPMHNGHFNHALKVESIHLGLETNVTSRAFRTSFAFKSILAGDIPDWQIAYRMGHFSGDLDLCRFTYVPTTLPIDPAREPGEPTDAARKVLESNGARRHLPEKDQIDPSLLVEAQRLVSTFYEALEREVADSSRRIPQSLKSRVQDLFQQINSGARLPFKESLAAMVSLTSNGAAASWTHLAHQPHPFDVKEIERDDGDAGILRWLQSGGPFLCPSCHASLHHDASEAEATLASEMYRQLNACSAHEQQRFCCFICSDLFDLDDGSHAAQCLKSYHSEPSRSCDTTFDKLAIIDSKSGQLYKAATHYACPVRSCLDSGWHQNEDNAWMTGNSVIAPTRGQRIELGGSKVVVMTKLSKFVYHLCAHFFEECLVLYQDGSKTVDIAMRLCIGDDEMLCCSLVKCTWHRSRDGERDDIEYLRHLINDHQLPLLRYGDGSQVQRIEQMDMPSIHLFWNGKLDGMDDVSFQCPDGSHDPTKLFAVIRPRKLTEKRLHSRQLPQSIVKEKSKQQHRAKIEKMSEEQLREFRTAANQRAKAQYEKNPYSEWSDEKKQAVLESNNAARRKRRLQMTPGQKEEENRKRRERYLAKKAAKSQQGPSSSGNAAGN